MEKPKPRCVAKTQRKTAVAEVIHEVAEKINKRSLVIIFSDMFDNIGQKQDALFSALQHLRHNLHEVAAVSRKRQKNRRRFYVR